MRKVSFLLIAALVAAAPMAPPVLAQDKAAEVMAADVLAKVRQTIGGGKLESLKTFSLVAATARNIANRQMTSEIELYLELPDKYLRVENLSAPVVASMTSGFNGEKVIRPAATAMGGGGMMIMNGVPMGGGGAMTRTVVVGGDMAGGGRGGGAPTPEQQAMMNASMIRSQRVELSRYMLGWFAMAHPALKATYTYGGEAESPDGKAHIINVKADGGFEAKLFVDEATNIPLMLTYQGPEPRVITRPGPSAGGAAPPPPPPPGMAGHGAPPAAAAGQAPMSREEIQKQMDAMRNQPVKMIEYRVYFGDWQAVDGITFPHSLQRAMAGTTTEEWTISKVKVNPKIDAKKFQ